MDRGGIDLIIRQRCETEAERGEAALGMRGTWLSGIGFWPEVVGIRHSRESGNLEQQDRDRDRPAPFLLCFCLTSLSLFSLDARLRGHDGLVYPARR
jgi:hypothetical protein